MINRSSVAALLGFRSFAILMAGLMVFCLWQRPYAPLLAVIIVVHAVLQLRWPLVWLASLPALLPLLDWSPWSGWLPLQEFEIFMLGILAVGYWNLPQQQKGGRLATSSRVLLGAYCLSWLAALFIGGDGGQAGLTESGSLGAMNVLRGAKGFILALLLLPLLSRAWSQREQALWSYFAPGALLGLGIAALAVVLERWLFTGLSDFASDYRAVGPFFEMFAGGAALDCYLSALLPICVWYLIRRRLDLWSLAGGAVLALATYAALVSFSRGVYLACVITAIVLTWAQHKANRKVSGPASVVPYLWLVAGGYALAQVFHFGGYRTLAAALLAWLAVLALAPASRLRLRPAQGVMTGVMVFVSFAPALLLPKGPYLATAVAVSMAVTGLVWSRVRPDQGLGMSWAGAIGLSLATPLVAAYWRADGEWLPLLAWLAYVWATLLLARFAGWWRQSYTALAAPGTLVLLLGLIVPVVGNYYMGSRFSTAASDLEGRLAHWSDVAALSRTPGAVLAGNGIGRFVDEYYWHNRRAELPSAIVLGNEGQVYARLIPPRTMRGYEDVVRLSQRVDVGAAAAFTLRLRVRSSATDGVLQASLCDKWLLYPFNCLSANVAKLDKSWQELSIPLRGQRQIDGKSRIRPTVLMLSSNNTNQSSAIDVADVRLEDANGKPLLQNGNFSRGLSHWYYTSDRHHLPWHAKNMLLHVFFEQGLIGLTLFVLLWVLALVALLSRMQRGDQSAPMLLGALMAVLAVGLFDSLLDFTRINVLVFLLLWLSLMRTRTGGSVRSAR